MASVKENDPVSAYLKCHILNRKPFQSSATNCDNDSTSESCIAASGHRILENEVKFEKVPAYSDAVADKLKGKYKLLASHKKIFIESSNAQPKSSCGLSPKKTLDFEDHMMRMKCETIEEEMGNVTLLLNLFENNMGVSNKIRSEGLPSPSTQLYPESAIKLGWQGTEPVGAGMLNLGNTCYLNSTLQALFHVPSFCNWLSSQTVHNGRGKCDQAFIAGEMCTICAMAATLRICRSQSGHVIKPALIYGRLRSICRHLSLGQQEDAHEFLRFLIESMERTFLLQYKGKKLDNLSKETTPLHRIFGGYLRNEVCCHTCGRVSTTFQLFQDLFLDIRLADSLTQSMKGFFSWEKLEGGEKDNCYKCEQCRDRGNCSKRVYIQMPPKVLCIQLKRFTALGKKITKHINYPIKLDLSPYIYNGFSKTDSPYKGIVQPLPYKLVSVVSHYGAALNCGHYTAIGLSAKGSYFMFDDSQVRPVSMSSALGTSAYILMYEMEPNWTRNKGTILGMNSTVKHMENNILEKLDSSISAKSILTQQGPKMDVSPLRICEINTLKPATVKLKSYSMSFSEEAKTVPNSTVDSDVKNNNSSAPIERLKLVVEARPCEKGDVESKTNNLCDEGSHSNQNSGQQNLSPNCSPKFSSKSPLKRSASSADSKPCKRQLTLPDLFRIKNKEITDRASLQPKIRTMKDWLVDRKSLPDEKGSRNHANASESKRWSVNGWKVTENDGVERKRKRGEDCVKRKRKLVNSEILKSLSQSKIPFIHSDNNKLANGIKRTEGVSVFSSNTLFQQL